MEATVINTLRPKASSFVACMRSHSGLHLSRFVTFVAKDFKGIIRRSFGEMQNRQVKAQQLAVAPAAERNKQPILDVLVKHIPDKVPLEALEIASGTGQHIVHFARHFRNITWQPCEYDQRSIQCIEDHIIYSQLPNVNQPLLVDASLPVEKWADGKLKHNSYDVIYSANMMHISPWAVSKGFIEGAGKLLKPSALLFVYGPFALDGVLEPQSNVSFNQSLRNRDPEWGIRDRCDVERVVKQNGIQFITSVDMPANNKTLIFKKV